MRHLMFLAFAAVLGIGLPRFGSADLEATPQALIHAARARTEIAVTYDGAYQRLAYPGGDVAGNIGVCTDLVIRAYRQLGIDLQQLVHEDMQASFDSYPSRWGLSQPDANIDHRRVPNLATFFTRHGQQRPASKDPSDYQAGDIVTWTLQGRLPHIGILSNRYAPGTQHPLVIHNVGAGPKEEDRLFAYPITGHYRYYPNP